MSNVEATSTGTTNLDVRPILPVSDETVLEKAIELRDTFAKAMAATLEQDNVRANLLKSEPGNYPAWVRLEAWTPVGGESPPRHERCELELIVEAKPFNRHSLTCGIRLKRGKQTIAAPQLSRLSEDDVREWTRHAIGRGPRPSSYRPYLDALRDNAAVFVPPLSRRYNPIARPFRSPLIDMKTLLAVAACTLLVIALIFRELLTPVTLAIAALIILVAFLFPVLARLYRHQDWVIPQPREGPRHLGHVDSWHAVLAGLGSEAEPLRNRLIAKAAQAAVGMLDVRSETYGYRAPNGYEERERIVISHRQGHVHVHIYPIGEDLFVGWQAHLNWAQWAETAPVTAVDAGLCRIAFRDVKPSWYYPNEFDLIDLNSLSAVVHNTLEREVKSLLSEHSIDQEVDFEVIRSDRGNALDARKSWPERQTKRGRNSNVIFGWGGVQRASAGEMQLTPLDAKPQGHPRGLAAIPAVILLPVLTALGYFWLYQSNGLLLYQFQQSVAPNFPFSFLPMFSLPLATALAIGLILYARISLIQALLVIAVIEASTFSVGYVYYLVGLHFIVLQDLRNLPIGFSFTAGYTILTSLCYLLAASIWAPNLRSGRRWLAAIILWPLWVTAGSWAIREFRIVGPEGFAISWGLRVFIAGCFGYWLWRDEHARSWSFARGDGQQRRTTTSVTAVERSATTRTVAIAQEARAGSGPLIAAAILMIALFASIAGGSPSAALPSYLLLGLTQGSLYALLGLGLAVIFRQCGITNFAQGALFMMGALLAFGMLRQLGLGYWSAILVVPLGVALIGAAVERLLLRPIYGINHAYGILMTYGIALGIQGLFSSIFGADAFAFPLPSALRGVVHLGSAPLPIYRIWVVLCSFAVCAGVWWLLGASGLGRNFGSVSAGASFGKDVSRARMLAFSIGAGLAALAGVLAAPIYTVSVGMGSDLINTIFAVLIVAGAGTVAGMVVAAILLGLIEALVMASYGGMAGFFVPLIAMVVVLMIRPMGLFGQGETVTDERAAVSVRGSRGSGGNLMAVAVMATLLILAPALFPHSGLVLTLLSSAMCLALFACALNLLLGQVGILSMGHAMFLATGAVVAAYAANLELPPELAILSGTVAATALAFVAGALVIRKRPIYSAMITAALGQIIYLFFVQSSWTGGYNGQVIPLGMMFGIINLHDRFTMYFVVMVIFLLGFLITYKAIHSSFGEALRDIREGRRQDRTADRYRLMAFVLSGAIAGLAGATQAYVYAFVSPEMGGLLRSGEGILMVLIGGIGSTFGPVVGAFVYTLASYYLPNSNSLVMAMGVASIVCTLLFRDGIVGMFVGKAEREGAAARGTDGGFFQFSSG